MVHWTKSVETNVGLVFLAFFVVVTAMQLWLQRQKLIALFRGVCSCLYTWLEEETPFERRVREECIRLRVETARCIPAIAMPFVTARHAAYLVHLSQGSTPMELQFAVVSFTFRILVAVLSLCPQLVTSKTIDVIYSVLSALVVMLALGADDTRPTLSSPQDYRSLIFVMTLVWTLFNPRMPLNALWLTAVAAAHTTRISSGGVFYVWLQHFGIFVLVQFVDRIINDSVRAKLLAAESDRQFTAVRTLLNSICDDVVEIDSGLRLTQHFPKLSSILLHGPVSSLRGVALDELIPSSEDRQNFARRMRTGSDATIHADVFHTRLRDSSGTTVAVELFSVPFRDLNDRQGHILGVREFTDTVPLVPQQREPPQTSAPLPRPVVQQLWNGTPAAAEQGDMTSHSGSQSSRPGSEGSMRARSGPSAPAIEPRAPPPASALQLQTNAAVKRSLLQSTLVTWRNGSPPGACCPFHTAVAEAERVLAGMARSPCAPQFGPSATDWQCQRCGVAADIFRPKRPSPCCRMCMDMTSENLGFATHHADCVMAL